MSTKSFVKLPKETVDSIVKGMIEINLKSYVNRDGEQSSNFRAVRNILTRMGVLKNNKIYQSVHILKKQNKYYLAHFKQLFALDGFESSFGESDNHRLIKIAFLLQKLEVIDVCDKNIFKALENPEANVYVHFVSEKDISNGVVVPVKKYDL